MSHVFALIHLLNGMPRGILKQGPKALLRVLIEHADARGRCWPSQALLCQAVECCERSVRNHLRHLEGRGFITIQQRGLIGNRYTVHEAAIRQACAQGTPFVPRDTKPAIPANSADRSTGKTKPVYRQVLAPYTGNGLPPEHQEPPEPPPARKRARGGKVLMQQGKALAARLEADLGIHCLIRWPDLALAYRDYGELLIDRLEGWSRKHGLARLDENTLRDATQGTRSQYGGYDIPPLPRQEGAA